MYFYGKSTLANHNNFYSATFNNCSFEDLLINPSVSAYENDEIKFINCTISSSNEYLINYAPANYTKVTLNNCSISNITNGKIFAYGYAKPSKGYLKLIKCNLNLPNLTTLFDCYPQYIENIENFNILLVDTDLNNNVPILSNKLNDNPNINITIL